jgi:hypothetical protein
MDPIVSDEWELEEWLIKLGYQPVLLTDSDPAIDARIKAALLSPRGKNFVTAERLHVMH